MSTFLQRLNCEAIYYAAEGAGLEPARVKIPTGFQDQRLAIQHTLPVFIISKPFLSCHLENFSSQNSQIRKINLLKAKFYRAKVKPKTFLAPPFFNTRAHSFIVAPVVQTSSKSKYLVFSIWYLGFILKAPWIFFFLSSSFSLT